MIPDYVLRWAANLNIDIIDEPLILEDGEVAGYWLDSGDFGVFITTEQVNGDFLQMIKRIEMSQEEIELLDDELNEDDWNDLYRILWQRLRDEKTESSVITDAKDRFAGFSVNRFITLSDDPRSRQEFYDALTRLSAVGDRGLNVLQASLEDDDVGPELERHDEMFG